MYALAALGLFGSAMKKSYKSETNVKIEIIFSFFEMRRMLKSRNLVEFEK